jgi:hypothetical protein
MFTFGSLSRKKLFNTLLSFVFNSLVLLSLFAANISLTVKSVKAMGYVKDGNASLSSKILTYQPSVFEQPKSKTTDLQDSSNSSSRSNTGDVSASTRSKDQGTYQQPSVNSFPRTTFPIVDDPNTVSLLHFNGSNGSNIFTDESGKVWTAFGNAQITTTQSKFGGASGNFDGSGDYLRTPYTSDFDLSGGDFTIDTWFNTNSFAAYQNLISKDTWGSNFDWNIGITSNTSINNHWC